MGLNRRLKPRWAGRYRDAIHYPYLLTHRNVAEPSRRRRCLAGESAADHRRLVLGVVEDEALTKWIRKFGLLCNPGQAAALLSGRPEFNLKVEARCFQSRLVKR